MKTSQYLKLSIITLLLSACYQPDSADLIIHNAKIYTCDSDFSVHQAMAIKDGKILQVGPEREILNGYDCDHIIDAELKPVYPGFYDAHCHFWGFANTLRTIDLTGSKSFNEVVTRVITFDDSHKPEWITGRGWDQNLWVTQTFPTNDTLNALFPNRPVLLRRVDGHAAIANQKALELAGITDTTTCSGGQIIKHEGGLTGVLIDNAVDLVLAKIPAPEPTEQLQLLQQAEKQLFAQGLTSINDAGVDHELGQHFVDWYQKGDLKIQSYMMLFPDDNNLEFAAKHGIVDTNGLHIRSFKLIADGALGSRGACLRHPYSDAIHQHGTLLKSVDEMTTIAKFAGNIDYQLNTHCIGDSANRVLLNIYKSVIGSQPNHRWKIEHAQVLAPEDFDFFDYLGVIPSVQPTHCTSDMPWAPERLGDSRIPYVYAYQTLLKRAGLIALGTDFPIEGISTLATFYAAVSRKATTEGAQAYNPDEKLSREQALMGMTYWAAYSNFEEQERGSLEAGKQADFIMLTQDIMRIPEDDILNTFVFATYLKGERVYTAL